MFISIVQILPSVNKTLDTRDQAIRLFESLKDYCPNCGDLTLDFKDVDFMSRSFADQFHKEKMNWHAKINIKILVENENHQVNQILKSVSRTQKPVERPRTSVQARSFNSREQVFQFLSAL